MRARRLETWFASRLPSHNVLAVIVPGTDAAGLRHRPADLPRPEDPLVDALEDRAERRGGHHVEVLEDGPPAARRDDETAEVPLLVPDDRRSLGEGLEREDLEECLPERGKPPA